MTTYETGRYDMLKRVCRFGEAHPQFFPEGSGARQTFAQVAKYVEELDALASARRDAKQHSWRRKAEAREALAARLTLLARIARDESRGVPGADARFPPPRKRWDTALLLHGKAFVSECPKAGDMFLRYGIPDAFVDDLKALVDAFDQSTHRGWNRRITIVVTRLGTATALARGLDAVQTLDVIVGNALAHEPALLTVWRDIRRNDSRRKTVSAPLGAGTLACAQRRRVTAGRPQAHALTTRLLRRTVSGDPEMFPRRRIPAV